MTKKEYDKITELLREEKIYKERTRLFKENYFTYKIKGYELGKSFEYDVFDFDLNEEDIELLYNASKNKLDKIKQELKELGYCD